MGEEEELAAAIEVGKQPLGCPSFVRENKKKKKRGLVVHNWRF
jgi:hypothetical protein